MEDTRGACLADVRLGGGPAVSPGDGLQGGLRFVPGVLRATRPPPARVALRRLPQHFTVEITCTRLASLSLGRPSSS